MTFINRIDIPKLSGLEVSNNYSFDSDLRTVLVQDVDIDLIVSIYNVTINKTLYIAGDESYTGTAFRSSVIYNNNVAGVTDSDDLYILYKKIDKAGEAHLLIEIKDQLMEINKFIKKIYNPE